MFKLLVNYIAFVLGWAVCTVGGNTFVWGGVLAGLALHAYLQKPSWMEWFAILWVGCFGFLVDAFLIHFMVFQPLPEQGLSPWWLVGIWIFFATTIRHSLKWLVGRPILGAISGGLAGMFVYTTAENVGSLYFIHPTMGPIVILATFAILVPALIHIINRW